MITQGTLFSSKQDAELRSLEEKCFANSGRFGELSESQRHFLIRYMTRGSDETVRDVAAGVGVSKTKAYEWLKDPVVTSLMPAVAQVVGVHADVRASLALDMLADQLFNDVRDGRLRHSGLTPVQLKLMLAAKDRLGLNPALAQKLTLAAEDRDGNRRSLTVESSPDATKRIESQLSKLLERQLGTGAPSPEARGAEAVRGEDSDPVKPAIEVQAEPVDPVGGETHGGPYPPRPDSDVETPSVV